MVIQITQSKTAKVAKVHPKTMSEITDTPYKKFIIKFGADFCGPCRKMEEYINKTAFTPKEDTAIYMINLEETENKIVEILRSQFEFRSIPYCVVTNKDFKTLDSQTGFNAEEFSKMFEKHFC